LLGQVFGPLLVGFLSDRLHPTFGDLSIRYAMLLTAGCAVAAGGSFWGAIRYIEQDVRRAAGPAEAECV
jgi:hypothetical protein